MRSRSFISSCVCLLACGLSACSWLAPQQKTSGYVHHVNRGGIYEPPTPQFLTVNDQSQSYVDPLSASQGGTTIGLNNYALDMGVSTPIYASFGTAYTQSGRIRSKYKEIQEAEESLIQAKAETLPSIELRGSYGYASRNSETITNGRENISSQRNIGNLGLTVSQPVYEGGRLKHQKNRARANIASARQGLRSEESSVLLETAVSHIEIIQNRNIAQLYLQSVDNLKAQKDTTDLLAQYGEATSADVSLVNARLKSAEIRASEAILQLNASKTDFAYLTGRSGENLLEPHIPELPSSLEEIMAVIQSQNPELLMAQADRDVAHQDLKIAKSARLPRLSLDGDLTEAMGQSELISRNSAATLTLNLRMPFSLGGQYKSSIRQASHQLSRRDIEIQESLWNLQKTATLNWNSLQSSAYALELRYQEIQLSETAYASLMEQFRAGVITQSDLLLSEKDLLDARIRLEQAKYDQLKLKVELLALMGHFSSEGEAPTLKQNAASLYADNGYYFSSDSDVTSTSPNILFNR